MSFIQVKNVTYQYQDSSTKALDNISLNINQGEFVSILGHNGCGKSTLSRLLNGLLIAEQGEVIINGINTADEESIYEVRSNLGLILQNPDNQLVTTVVEEDVAFGCENLCLKPDEIRKRVDNALKAVGMYDYRMFDTYRLSGGQKQKIAIAGILAMKPKCIVLDEPTAMLDISAREEIIKIIKSLNQKEKITIILITHYMEEAIESKRVIVMNKGKIVLDNSPDIIFSQVELLKSYGLDVPQSIELIYNLRKRGYKIDYTLSAQGCINNIVSLLQGNDI